MKKNNVKQLVGLSSLMAIVVVLQLISTVVRFGPFSITLALIPLVVGAIIYGPYGGGILGFVMGFVVLLTNAEAFWVVNPFATVLICLVKSTVAGIVSGLIYSAFKKNHEFLGVTLASIFAPIVNTLLFAIGCLVFFFPTLREWADGSDTIGYLFLTMIGLNFIIEFVVNSVLSPAVYYIKNIIVSNYHVGQEGDEQ